MKAVAVDCCRHATSAYDAAHAPHERLIFAQIFSQLMIRRFSDRVTPMPRARYYRQRRRDFTMNITVI